MIHDRITILLPYLDIKEPVINTVGSFSGNTGVHHINSRIIVLVNLRKIFLGKPKLTNHIPQEPSSLGISYIINDI